MVKLRILLHAQTLNDPSGLVAGSEITTLGLQRALVRESRVESVERIGPSSPWPSAPFDLLLIEGYHACLDRLIAHMRRVSPALQVIHWCLSTLGFAHLRQLGVNGFLTNSSHLIPILSQWAPTRFLHLAVDPTHFYPGAATPHYAQQIAYLGRPHGCGIQEALLAEAGAFDLGLWGAGWENHPIFSEIQRGPLPIGDSPSLYRSAQAILCTTEPRQRTLGMLNNRLFEAVASGIPVLSEWFEEAETTFKGQIHCIHKPGELAHLLRKGPLKPPDPEWILQRHTYAHRTPEILNFYEELCL
jgi:hypothetical protein